MTVGALGYTLGVIIFLDPQAWTMLLLNGGIALVTGLPRILDGQQEQNKNSSGRLTGALSENGWLATSTTSWGTV
ncbi:hypothetical protein [Ornithinimicrobium sp. INDO-MA30-4]|uniref:hypothetical protein n=1 Tax=Ornithinimicrobium sp. INDO-MA30-4 TaxID=2908651 RepID=UPI001F4669D5|nr:hypothetical protein [Ornithinimicrobium sp. INDO-MA30-4]UJH69902.1 hypothetical protein L0A91_11745 [Ornithinimicrobium sp. INDO-MA30-4]